MYNSKKRKSKKKRKRKMRSMKKMTKRRRKKRMKKEVLHFSVEMMKPVNGMSTITTIMYVNHKILQILF
jgi:hypothetical protein